MRHDTGAAVVAGLDVPSVYRQPLRLMAWTIKRRLWLVVKLSALFAGGFVAYQVFAPQFRSTAHFVPVEGEPRVRYEPGAERAAKVIAQALPEAIRTVEAAHFRTFVEPVTIYVCATEESFERYGLRVKSAGGFVYAGRLFISPKPQNTSERLPRLLTHELSHLHLEQYVGLWWGARHLPGWFKEGLAVNAAHGGGAENVSEAEARDAIVRGRVFRRDTTGSLFFPQTAERDGLPTHLYYRESALFMAFLAQRSPSSFQQLLLAIQERTDLATAVQKSFGRTIPTLWSEFLSQLAPAGTPEKEIQAARKPTAAAGR